MQNSATEPLISNFSKWSGSINGRNSGIYIDQFAMLIMGGIPMQVCEEWIMEWINYR